MNRRLMGFLLLVALLVGGLSYDVTQTMRLRDRERSAAEAQRQADATQLALQREARRLSGLLREQAQVRSAAAAAAAKAAEPTPSPEGEAARAVNAYRVIASSPVLRSQYSQLMRDSLDLKWNLLFHQMNLSPARLEAFKDALSQRLTEDLQVYAAAQERGLDPASAAMQAYQEQLDRTYKDEMRDAIGPANYAAYKAYSLETNVVGTVVSVAGNMLTTPLTNDQGLQLAKVLADASQRDANGKAVENTVNIDQAMAAAQPFLDPDQLGVLNAILVKRQVRDQLDALTKSK